MNKRITDSLTHIYPTCFSLFLNINGLIFFIVLDPETKMNHFMKHWSKPLQDKVLESTETIVCFFYYTHAILLIFNSLKNVTQNYMVQMAHHWLLSRKITRSSLVYLPKIQQMTRQMACQLQQLHHLTQIPINHGYMNSSSTLMESMGMTIMKWWGVCYS